jgi:hypothetical protein
MRVQKMCYYTRERERERERENLWRIYDIIIIIIIINKL